MEASKKVDSTSPLQTNPPLKLPPSTGVAVLVPELGGYKERFVKAVEDKYKCEKCRLVLCDPKQTECGHRFCDSCMAALLRLVWLGFLGACGTGAGSGCPGCVPGLPPQQVAQPCAMCEGAGFGTIPGGAGVTWDLVLDLALRLILKHMDLLPVPSCLVPRPLVPTAHDRRVQLFLNPPVDPGPMLESPISPELEGLDKCSKQACLNPAARSSVGFCSTPQNRMCSESLGTPQCSLDSSLLSLDSPL